MQVRVAYKDGEKECQFIAAGTDIVVDLLTDNGIDIRQIPAEEYTNGFRAKENSHD